MQLFANNITTTVAVSINAAVTSLTVASGTGMPSPTGGDYFLLTLFTLNSNGQENAWEIIKVTARSANVLTIVRAQEDTTALSWGVASPVQMRATSDILNISAAHIANISNPHSVTKTSVGLGSVDNTSDINKPVSTAQQTALNTKEASLPSPTGKSGNILSTNGSNKEWIAGINSSVVGLVDGTVTSKRAVFNLTGITAATTRTITVPDKDIVLGAAGIEYITTAQVLSNGGSYLLDSTAGGYTVTLPATPSVGDIVTIADPFNSWGVNNIVISRNGSNVLNEYGQSVAEDITLDVGGLSLSIVYNGTSWRLI